MTFAPVALAAMLAATPLTDPKIRNVHTHAAIISSVGIAAALGGGVALGVGLHNNHDATITGGAALIVTGLNIIVLAIFAWIWPGPLASWHESP
jgi:hypothetical protein